MTAVFLCYRFADMSESTIDKEAPGTHRLAVVCLAGDPSLHADADGDLRESQRAAQRAAKAVASLVREGFGVVVVPAGRTQLDCELVRGEEASTKLPQPPLSEASASAQGAVGSRLEAALRNVLRQENLQREVATLVTQILVGKSDPAFGAPDNPVGPVLPSWRARELARSRGVHVIEEAGKGWRRVAAAPVPAECLSLGAIEALLQANHVVLTAAGGGIPVAVDTKGQLAGTESLVDELQVATLIANELAADVLVFMNPTEHVSAHTGQVNQARLEQPTRHELRDLRDAGAFPEPTLAARIDATLDFLDAGGETVLLTAANKLTAALAGRSGTRVTREAITAQSTQQISLFAATDGGQSEQPEPPTTHGGPS